MVNINEAYKQLTPEHQRELEDFAEFLLNREHKSNSYRSPSRNFRPPGFGSLSSLASTTDGVTLQHLAQDLRK